MFQIIYSDIVVYIKIFGFPSFSVLWIRLIIISLRILGGCPFSFLGYSDNIYLVFAVYIEK